MPACPRKRRVAVHIFFIPEYTGIQKKLDAPFGSECSATMEWCFCLCPAIAHESIGPKGGLRYAVWVRAVHEQDLKNVIIDRSIDFAKGCVQRCLAYIRQRTARFGALFNEELAELPMVRERQCR